MALYRTVYAGQASEIGTDIHRLERGGEARQTSIAGADEVNDALQIKGTE